jgi:hypothetical protein
MRAPFQKYVRWLLLVLLIGAAGVVAFNLLVDPFGAYRWAHLEKMEPYRSGIATREAKAELAARGTFETVVIGSSRMRMGLPTTHPAYGTTNVCNLGLAGTMLEETSGTLDYALKKNPVQRVLFGADFHTFSASRGVDPTFLVSRFNPQLDVSEYHGRNLLGARALGESWPLFKDWIRGRPALVGDRGSVPKYLPERSSQREAFARRVRASLVSLGAEGSFVRSPERLETFRKMVRQCRARNVELIIFIPPIHALQLEAVAATGKWDSYEEWKRDLVRILAEEGATDAVPLWDFQGFAGLLAEPVPSEADRKARMKYYMEASHFTPALGGLVLERILNFSALSPEASAFGARLTPANLDAQLARVRAERAAYAAQNPSEIAWVNAIAEAAKKSARSTSAGDDAP